ELVKAAAKVIVTAERIVPTDAFRAAPERTSFPGYAVDHVVHAPRGAWPTAEVMVTALARELDDETRVFNGAASFIPIAAFMLARATHAPGLTWAAGSIGVDAHPVEIPESTISDRLFEGSTMLQSSPSDVWAYAGAAKLDTFCFRG